MAKRWKQSRPRKNARSLGCSGPRWPTRGNVVGRRREASRSSFKTRPCLRTGIMEAWRLGRECAILNSNAGQEAPASLVLSSYAYPQRRPSPTVRRSSLRGPYLPSLSLLLAWSLAAGPKKARNKHNKKCFLPFRLWILHLALEPADSPATLISDIQPFSFRFLLLLPPRPLGFLLLSTSHGISSRSLLSSYRAGKLRATFWRAKTGRLSVSLPVPILPSPGYPYLTGWPGQHPRSKPTIRSNLLNGVF